MQLNYHAAVGGATQTGKTTTALALLGDQPGLRIFINTKCDPVWDKYFHFVCKTIEELKEVLNYKLNKTTFYGLNIAYYPDIYQDFADISTVTALTYTFHTKRKLKRTTICFDEAHNFMSNRKAPKWVTRIFAQGLSLNLFGIVVTQRFQQIHPDILHNCETIIIHQIVSQDIKYLEEKGSIDVKNSQKLIFLPICNKTHNGRQCGVSHSFYLQQNVLKGVLFCM